MNQRAQDFLRSSILGVRANCFNIVQLYFGDITTPSICGPEEFVTYMQLNFYQLDSADVEKPEDVLIVWSRTSDFLPIGSINLKDLKKDQDHYPFGLVIEHAFILMDSNMVFQKPNPSIESDYEIISKQSAVSPYLSRFGFEITRHRRL